jgi:WD domain, G-beta repeat
VFPADTQIPTAAIARYWSRTRGADLTQTRRYLTTLAEANVLRYEQDGVGFHDLQYDYLLLHAPALALLHTELVDAYRAALPADADDQWWRLPVGEPYIWDQLVTHLRAAGNRAVLSTTVTSPAYLAHRVAASGTHAAEADLARAAEALPTNAKITWWRHWMARHADLLTGARGQDGADPSSTARITPTMLAWLTADQALPDTIDPQQLSTLLPAPFLTPRWGLTPPPQTLIRVLTGHPGRVTAVAWSPNGTRLASAGDDGEIRIWDPTTGHTQTTLTDHTRGVTAVAWSPDGTRLASASYDGTVLVHDLQDNNTTRLRLLPLTCLAWSATGIAVGAHTVAWSSWSSTTTRRNSIEI